MRMIFEIAMSNDKPKPPPVPSGPKKPLDMPSGGNKDKG